MIYILIGYLIYVALAFLLQRQMLFPGQHFPVMVNPADPWPGLEVWSIEIEAGSVEAWFIPSPQASAAKPAPVVIHTHGNGEVIDYWPASLSPFLEMGFSLLLVEYPGYGRSAGSPSQQSIERVMLAAYDRLVTRPEVDAHRIIAYGRSLGGGAVCALAAKRPTAALILESTWTSTRPFAYKYALPGFLMRDPFDNLAVVKRYEQPILIIHGTTDDIIPLSHGETLAQHARQGTFITYRCGHNDCPPDRKQYWEDVSGFLEKTGMMR